MNEQGGKENIDPDLFIENKFDCPRDKEEIVKSIHRLNSNENDEDDKEYNAGTEMPDK